MTRQKAINTIKALIERLAIAGITEENDATVAAAMMELYDAMMWVGWKPAGHDDVIDHINVQGNAYALLKGREWAEKRFDVTAWKPDHWHDDDEVEAECRFFGYNVHGDWVGTLRVFPVSSLGFND